jgi:hypothetical protein
MRSTLNSCLFLIACRNVRNQLRDLFQSNKWNSDTVTCSFNECNFNIQHLALWNWHHWYVQCYSCCAFNKSALFRSRQYNKPSALFYSQEKTACWLLYNARVTMIFVKFPGNYYRMTELWRKLLGLLNQQEVLGRINRLPSLIRHGPHWKLRVQQFFYCCLCICYLGNVSTETFFKMRK